MAILLILLLGLGLRLINLNQSLWLDETVQAITSKGSFLGLFTELKGDFHPPLYHFLIWGWVHLFGNGEIVMRMPSVIFGTATIWFVYQIAKLMKKGNFFPLFTVLLIATAPFHIYYSQEGRMYAFAAFATVLSFYYFLRMMIGEKPNKVAYVLSTTLMLYSDYYGLFGFLAQIMIAFWLWRKKAFQIIPSFLMALTFFLPCLPLLWIQLKTGSQATFSLPGWGTLVNLSLLKALPLTFIKFAIGRITIFNKTIYAFLAGIIFLVYGFLMIKSLFKGKKLSADKSLIIILFWLAIPVLLAWAISIFVPNYQPFRLLFVLPAFYLLLAYGISSLSSTLARRLFLVFVLLVNLVSLFVYYQNPYFHREDWRGAVRFIEQQEGKTLALLPSETSHWPYTYYSKGKVKLISVGQDIRPVNEDDLKRLSGDLSFSIINSQFSIYYVYYLADLFDPQNLIPNWLESQKFVKIGEVSFNQIRIQEWKQKDQVQ